MMASPSAANSLVVYINELISGPLFPTKSQKSQNQLVHYHIHRVGKMHLELIYQLNEKKLQMQQLPAPPFSGPPAPTYHQTGWLVGDRGLAGYRAS